MSSSPQKRSRKHTIKVQLNTFRLDEMRPDERRQLLDKIDLFEIERQRAAVKARQEPEAATKLETGDGNERAKAGRPSPDEAKKVEKDTPPRGRPKTPLEISESLVNDFLAERNRRVCARSAREPSGLCPKDYCTRCQRAIDAVCSALAETETWKYAVKKGIPVERNGENVDKC